MKGKTALYLAAALMVLGACGKPGLKEPWDKGGFETGEYRNVFVEVGHSPAEVEQKLEEVFQEVFFGPDRCYRSDTCPTSRTMTSAPKASPTA